MRHNNKTVAVSIFLFFLFAAVFYGIYGNRNKQSQDKKFSPQTVISEKRAVSYTLTVKNTSSRPLVNTVVSVYGPRKIGAFQKVEQLDANYPFAATSDSFANQVLDFNFELIPPFGVKVIQIRSSLLMHDKAVPEPATDPQLFLKEEPYIEITNPELIQKAKQFSAQDPLASVQEIFAWIGGNIEKTSYSHQNRGALYTLHKKKGDCTEFMHLFTALSRLRKIPARGVSGYVVSQDKRLQADEFHDWAEVFLNGSWRVVDPFNNVMLEKENEYVAIRVHIPGDEQSNFHRWKINDKNLSVSMKK
jgi:transglutaminase-like putative cysteine protease